MTNEELALLAQGGDREALSELWAQVRGLVWKYARRWAGRGGATMEDLIQAGFIAVLRAVGSFDPEKARFSTYLFPFLQTEFAIATGLRLKRTALDPLQTALSLDTPLTDDGDDPLFLADTVEDPEAEAAFLDVEQDDLHNALEAALATLSEAERRVVVAHYYQGQTLAEIAVGEGASKAAVCQREQKALARLRHPSRSTRLRAFLFAVFC